MAPKPISILFVCHHGFGSSKHAASFADFLQRRRIKQPFTIRSAGVDRPCDDLPAALLSSDHVCALTTLAQRAAAKTAEECHASCTIHFVGPWSEERWYRDEVYSLLLEKIPPKPRHGAN